MGQPIQLHFETQEPLPPRAQQVLGWINSERTRGGRVFIIEQINQSDKENPDLQSALSLLIRYLSESDGLAIDFTGFISTNLKILVKAILRQKYPNFENEPLTAEEILQAVSEDLQGFYFHTFLGDAGPYFVEEASLPFEKVTEMYKAQATAVYEAEQRRVYQVFDDVIARVDQIKAELAKLDPSIDERRFNEMVQLIRGAYYVNDYRPEDEVFRWMFSKHAYDFIDGGGEVNYMSPLVKFIHILRQLFQVDRLPKCITDLFIVNHHYGYDKYELIVLNPFTYTPQAKDEFETAQEVLELPNVFKPWLQKEGRSVLRFERVDYSDNDRRISGLQAFINLITPFEPNTEQVNLITEFIDVFVKQTQIADSYLDLRDKHRNKWIAKLLENNFFSAISQIKFDPSQPNTIYI